MRFVRHAGMPHWGLGVVLGERGCAVDIHFEGAGYKRLTPGFPKLLVVSEQDVAPDHPLRSLPDTASRPSSKRPR